MPCTTLTVRPAPPPPPAALQATDISVSPSEVRVGESTDITVTIENTGGAPGSAIVPITVNGREIERLDTGTVGPGEIIALSYTWTPREAGTFRVCAEVV